MRLPAAVLAIAITLTALSLPSAQEPNVPLVAETPSPPSSLQARPAADEVAVLRGELEVTREYHRAILSTVYWALGIVVTLVIAMLAVGWFVNFKLYERDRVAMLQELKSEARNEVTRIAGELDERARGAARQALQDMGLPMMRDQLNALRVEWRESLAKQYLAADNKGMALVEYTEALKAAIDTLEEWRLSDFLDEIEKLLASGVAVDGRDRGIIHATLSRLPGTYAVNVERIRRLLLG